jgi:uncharacterized protein YbjT (DUF2867 family)
VTAFVLGATGFVGREVVRQLCARGTQTVAHIRPDSSKLQDWRQKFAKYGATIDTSPWDVAALAQGLDKAKATELYILIGTTKHRAKAEHIDGDIYEQIDYGLTKLAVDAANASTAKPRIVYLSGLGADAKARSAYMRARGKAEAAVRSSGLAWNIARPALITGDRDDNRTGEKIGKVVGDGALAVVGVFSKPTQLKWKSTSADVLASALIRLGESPEHDRIVDGAELR